MKIWRVVYQEHSITLQCWTWKQLIDWFG